jgi:GNAT superfamily N-acetyltransferase
MTLNELLTIFDQDQRRDVEYPDLMREIRSHLIRGIDRYGGHSAILYSQINADNAEAVIDEEMAFFAALGHEVEWKVYSHDQPPDLTERLRARGFTIDDPEAVVVFDLEAYPDAFAAPVTHDIRPVTTAEDIRAMMGVKDEVWGEDAGWLGERLIQELADTPQQISLYAGYADGMPVSAAWTRFPPNSLFASLWGGSTRAAYRGRGFYTALLTLRAQEVRTRRRRFLTVDASPMSRPILEKFGFVTISTAYACTWKA